MVHVSCSSAKSTFVSRVVKGQKLHDMNARLRTYTHIAACRPYQGRHKLLLLLQVKRFEGVQHRVNKILKVIIQVVLKKPLHGVFFFTFRHLSVHHEFEHSHDGYELSTLIHCRSFVLEWRTYREIRLLLHKL